MKKQLITLFASLFLITNAYALEFGVGVSGSLAMVDAGGTETEAGNTGAEASLRTKNVDAITPVGSIYAEAILDSGWALGFEIVPMSADVTDKIHSRTDVSIAASGEGVTGTNTRTADATVEDFQTIYVEALLGSNFFAKVGYSEIDVVVTEKQLTNMTRHKNEVLAGATVGLGVRGEWLGFNTKTAIEYTDFDEYKSTVSTSLSGTKTITADLDVTQVKFSMGKQF